MTDLQIYLTLAVFAAVIIAIAFDLIDMAVAALLGVGTMLALGLLNNDDLLAAARTSGGPLVAAVRRHGGCARAGQDRGIRTRRANLSARHPRQRKTLPAPADSAGRTDLCPVAQRNHRDPACAGDHQCGPGAQGGFRRPHDPDGDCQQRGRHADAGGRSGDFPGGQCNRHDFCRVSAEGQPRRPAGGAGGHPAAAVVDAAGMERARGVAACGRDSPHRTAGFRVADPGHPAADGAAVPRR